MGLDMYLIRKRKIGKAKIKMEILENEYDWYKNTGAIKELNNVTEIQEEVGYWRKANHIHKWFVDNIQNGNDDCGKHYVEIEKLRELLEICKKIKENCKLVDGEIITSYTIKNGVAKPNVKIGKVIQNKEFAEKTLPTTEGFFFGSTEYDEFYMEDIEKTIKIIEKLLEEKDVGSIYYESSW